MRPAQGCLPGLQLRHRCPVRSRLWPIQAQNGPNRSALDRILIPINTRSYHALAGIAAVSALADIDDNDAASLLVIGAGLLIRQQHAHLPVILIEQAARYVRCQVPSHSSLIDRPHPSICPPIPTITSPPPRLQLAALDPASQPSNQPHSSKMLEGLLARFLASRLGNYVDGLDQENLNVALWRGEILLEHLRVK